ncbi:MAG: sigma-70 family RNA polymerase sigma factor [Acidobacteriota bacterium]|jgi:RNA polymerase sigma-70 factor (ECF subfamily)|nr:sigma-70 family RNA polymerase sigma factor [Acidobacteriota bacterium]
MQDLIAGLKARDRSAFERVMSMFKTKIYNYLRMMVHDPELAEELTQDTFVKVFFKAHTLRSDNLKAWIYTIATNLARNEFRRRQIRHWLSLDEIGEGAIAVHPSQVDNMTLESLLAGLPAKYRAPVVLKEINNFSFKEIAAMTGKPVGTVKTLVFRGKERMRAMLEKQQSTEDSLLSNEGFTRALVNGGLK